MKIKSSFLTLFVIGMMTTGFAQRSSDVVDILWGDNVTLAKKHFPVGFIGNGEEGYMQISERLKKEIGFYLLTPKLKFESQKLEPLPKSKYAMFERIVEYDGRAFFLISDFDKATESEKLLIREIDMKEGGFLKEATTVIETDGKVTGDYISTGFYSASVTNKFKTVIPDKGDRILVFYRRKPEVRRNTKNYDKIVFNLFDRDWKKIWEKEVTMPYTEADMYPMGYRLIGDEIFMFASTKSGEINPETKRPEFDRVVLLHITEDQKKPEEYALEMNGIDFQDFIVGKGFGESILIGGYVKPNRRSSVYNGYFTAVFNPETKQMENINQYAFSQDLIASFERERTKRKLDKAIAKGKDVGIPYLEIRKIVRRPGGGWYVVGEQYHFYVISTTDSRGNTRSTYHYLFQDVIVAAVDASGNEEWIRKVAKNQHFVNSTYGAGISSFVYEDHVYVFHLDHVKNKDLNEDSGSPVEFRSFKDGCLMCVKIGPGGEMERSSLFDIRDESKLILPGTIDEIQPGVLLSSGRRSRLIGGKVNTPALIYLK